jgi:hypothetical protein
LYKIAGAFGCEGKYKAIARAKVEHVAVTRVANEEKGLTNLRDRQRRQA